MNFKVGDVVAWESQSLGYVTQKTGTVVAVVSPGREAVDCLPDGTKPRGTCGFGMPRQHESYLVRVGESCRIYWPVVKRLKRAICGAR